MKLNSLGVKASLIVALTVAALVAVILIDVSAQSDDLIESLTSVNAKAANAAFVAEVNALQQEALVIAGMIAQLHGTVDAIERGDMSELHDEIMTLASDMDFVTVCDANGIVITRLHSDEIGDSVMDQDVFRLTLQSGQNIGTIAREPEYGLVTKGSAVIKDYDGNVIGAIVCSHELTNPVYVDNLKARSNCEATLFDFDTRVSTTLINEKGERVIGTKASDAVIEAVIKNKNDYPLNIELFGTMYAAYYSPLIVDNEVMGMLFTGVDIEHALAGQKSMFNAVLIACIIGGVICVVIIFVFNVFSVTIPLKKLGAFAEKIRTGDLGISSSVTAKTGIKSKDEVGILARTLEDAYSELRGYIGEISERMQGLKDGDLASESTYNFNGDFILIKESINSITQNLNQIMSEINTSSSQVASASKQIADGSQMLAQGSTEQAASIEQLSASISDIAEKTRSNASMANDASKLSDTIRDNAEKGSKQMDEMMAAVNEINNASQSISKVIKTIDDIAFQTNILALNAAVEAARAGQHGKGFAVVAEEVRNLASKSAEAANETGNMIQNSIQKAELGTQIAGETAASLSEIVTGINESVQIIGTIAESSAEQSEAITQINTGIDQVAQVVQQNSATAEQSAAASEQMSGQSDILQSLIAQFKLEGGSGGGKMLPPGK